MVHNSIIQVPQAATDYNLYDALGTPGMLYGNGTPVVMPFLNRAGQVKAQWTIGIPATVDANTTYSVTVNGTTVSAETGGSTTQAQLLALLLNALRATMAITIGHKITGNGSTTITIESLVIGSPLAVSSASNASTTNDLTLTEVSASANGGSIPFGRFVGRKHDFAPRVAGLIDSASTTHSVGNDGYLLHGVTISTHAGERMGRGLDIVDGYKPFDSMNVFSDRGNSEGIWVECTPENDITEADTYGGSSLFVATTTGFEGMLTKDDTTYTGLSLGSKVSIMHKSEQVLGNKVIALVNYGNLAA